jgi:NAD-dependent dihydropyrimidine dehydrogenase PreA subunit
MTELPFVDAGRCRCWGDCIAICPTICLEMGKSLPRLARPLDCIACEVCVYVCPEGALQMEDVDHEP